MPAFLFSRFLDIPLIEYSLDGWLKIQNVKIAATTMEAISRGILLVTVDAMTVWHTLKLYYSE